MVTVNAAAVTSVKWIFVEDSPAVSARTAATTEQLRDLSTLRKVDENIMPELRRFPDYFYPAIV
jgi:hypothetical protein